MEGMRYLDGQMARRAGECACRGAGRLDSRFATPRKEVNLVMAPPASGPVRVEITLDGRQRAGDDVKLESGRAMITVDRPRMYNLVANETSIRARCN